MTALSRSIPNSPLVPGLVTHNQPSGYLTAGDTLQGQSSYNGTISTLNGTVAQDRSIYADVEGSQDHYNYLRLFTPNDMDIAVPRPITLYMHGSSAWETQPIPDSPSPSHHAGPPRIFDACLDAGHIFATLRLGTDVNDGNPEGSGYGKWGNNPCRVGMRQVMEWFTEHFNLLPEGFFFFGVSAGGTFSMNALMEAKSNGYDVAGISCIDPALWMRNMVNPEPSHGGYHDLDPYNGLYKPTSGTVVGPANDWYMTSSSSLRARISAAYDIDPENAVYVEPPGTTTGWTANIDTDMGGHDPCEVAVSTHYLDVPILLFSSWHDTTCCPKDNALKLQARFLAAGFTSEFTVLGIDPNTNFDGKYNDGTTPGSPLPPQGNDHQSQHHYDYAVGRGTWESGYPGGSPLMDFFDRCLA